MKKLIYLLTLFLFVGSAQAALEVTDPSGGGGAQPAPIITGDTTFQGTVGHEDQIFFTKDGVEIGDCEFALKDQMYCIFGDLGSGEVFIDTFSATPVDLFIGSASFIDEIFEPQDDFIVKIDGTGGGSFRLEFDD